MNPSLAESSAVLAGAEAAVQRAEPCPRPPLRGTTLLSSFFHSPVTSRKLEGSHVL